MSQGIGWPAEPPATLQKVTSDVDELSEAEPAETSVSQQPASLSPQSSVAAETSAAVGFSTSGGSASAGTTTLDRAPLVGAREDTAPRVPARSDNGPSDSRPLAGGASDAAPSDSALPNTALLEDGGSSEPGPSSPLRTAASIGLGDDPIATLTEPVSRETEAAEPGEPATAADAEPAAPAPAEGEDEEFPESPRPVDDYPLETAPHAGIHPQRPVDEPGGKPAPTPTDILFGPSTAPIGMGAMTAAQIAARATSDELQRRLLETPIAAATERTLLVNEGRTMGREFPLPAETRVFVVANQKGGVGKTTTTVNVAAGLALYGARILVIDLDPQGNASTALGIEHSEGTPGVYEAVIEGEPLSKLLAPCAEHPGIVVVPATIDLAGAEIELVSIVARESRLKKALDAHLAETEAAGEKYDYVFIDCPPSLGLLTVNALTAAREVLVPIQSEYYALEGLSQLLRHIDMVKAHLNPTLDVSTILLTMYDARTKLAGEVAAEVRGHFQDAVLRTAVPRSVRISEAPSHGQTVLAYDPASAGALSYLEASREIAMRNNAS